MFGDQTPCLYPGCGQYRTTTLGLCRLHSFDHEYRSFRDDLRQGRRKPQEALPGAEEVPGPTLVPETPPALPQGRETAQEQNKPLLARLATTSCDKKAIEAINVFTRAKMGLAAEPDHAVSRMADDGCPHADLSTDNPCKEVPAVPYIAYDSSLFKNVNLSQPYDQSRDPYFDNPDRDLAKRLRWLGKQLYKTANTLTEVKENRFPNGVCRTYKSYGKGRSPMDVHDDKDAPPDLPHGTRYSLIKQFRRYLECPNCELMAPVSVVLTGKSFNLSWHNFEFHGICPACGSECKFTVHDMPQRHKPPFLKVWKSDELTPRLDEDTGKAYYAWRLPEDYKARIYAGDAFYMTHAPSEVFDACREHRDVRIPSSEICTA